MAKNRLDALADRLGSRLLAAIWRAEFSLLLRHWKCSDRNRTVAGKSADIFLGSLRIVTVSIAVHDRSRRCTAYGTSPDRRNRVHVRSAFVSSSPLAEPVSRHHSA